MKYLLLDGKNVDVEGCKSCPLCQWVYHSVADVWDISCRYPGVSATETIEGEITDDHYMKGCPLSAYQSLHHLYVSAKCIYVTIKTLYNNFMEWWNGRKRLA